MGRGGTERRLLLGTSWRAARREVPGTTDLVGPSRLESLLEAGVTLFLDLTEAHELDPYAHLLDGGARHVRMPIPDMGVITHEQMRRTLDLIDRERARRGTTYVHCWGGAGRTGTVVGCWLVRHGLGGDAALARIAALRADTPALWLDSPQTEEQRAMVRAWSEALR